MKLSSHKAAGKFAEEICHLAATQPFDLARSYIKRIDCVEVTETMIRETAEGCGMKFIMEEDEKNSDKTELPALPHTKNLYIEADGSTVPIRPENGGKTREFREVKVGVLFREEDLKRKPDGSCSVARKRFATSLGRGVAHFESLLKNVAGEVGAARARTIVFISDGAEWIDQMRLRLFRKSIHILDWYHAQEHLWLCAKKIFGEKSTQKIEAWVEPLKQMLWDGLTVAVCERLLFDAKRFPKAQTEIRDLRSYYQSRVKKMRYPEFRRLGYFIGSGAVESAHKYLVQSRLKQAGMKWTIPGAEAVIKLRELLYDGRWDVFWGRPAA